MDPLEVAQRARLYSNLLAVAVAAVSDSGSQ